MQNQATPQPMLTSTSSLAMFMIYYLRVLLSVHHADHFLFGHSEPMCEPTCGGDTLAASF